MENEEKKEVIIDSSEEENNEEVEEETTDETPETEEENKPKETLEQKQARLKRQLSKVNKKLGISEEKPKEAVKSAQKAEEGLSQKDVIAISTASARGEIHEDDVEEIVEYARFKKISVNEAIKSDVMKATIERNKEFRASAEATNTKKARAGTKSVTGDQLNRNLSKGEIPEKGSKEAEELFWARRGGKRQ